MKKLLFLTFVLLAAACGENVKASVNCSTVAGPAVECDVQQTLGKSEIEVCWDFAIKCANGHDVKAPHTCQKVKDGSTVKTTIPGDKLEGVDGCGGDSPPTMSLTNMTINGKKAE